MIYQIDQSGKIEQSGKDTVIAYSNTVSYSVLLPKRIKRQVKEAFRVHGFTTLYTYYLFSVVVYYLLDHLKDQKEVIIDIEYPGKEKLITSFIFSFLEKNHKPFHAIHFARIGNKPRVHYAAKDVFDGKKKPNRILSLNEIIQALKKTDGRLRECLSTLVDAQSRSVSKRYHKMGKKSKKIR